MKKCRGERMRSTMKEWTTGRRTDIESLTEEKEEAGREAEQKTIIH